MVTGSNFGPLVTAWPPNWGVWSAADTALPLGVREPQVENSCPSVNDTIFLLKKLLIG